MHLIPSASPDEVITVEKAPGGRVELRIGRTTSRTAILTAAEARRVAEALMEEAEE